MSAAIWTVAVSAVIAAFLAYRNRRVYTFRLDLIRQVSGAAQADIDAGLNDWQWRYDVLDSVSYGRMMMSVRPLRPGVWYQDTAFLSARAAPRERRCVCDVPGGRDV